MIEINKLEKSFGNKRVLNNLTFTIAKNSIYGLLGPNGSGKTTTINVLSNLLYADAGNIIVEGNPSPELRKQLIGVVPQEISVYQDLTCREDLQFFAAIYGLQGLNKSKQIDKLVKMFNLYEYENTKVSKLSGGWRRRVNIAIALVHSPTILIMDEPTAGLDVEARIELWEIIKSLKHNGVSVLLTTHQLDEAERLCSRIGIIQNGRIIAEGSVDELRALLPAKQIAIVETDDEYVLRRKVDKMGWEIRPYSNQLLLYLPEIYMLKEAVDRFDGIPLRSVSLQEVGLEHIYMEVTRE
jgi:ABC-2 type transport system ATP-binding protein